MLATAKNYDMICLQMRSYLPHLDAPIKKETTRFLKLVRNAVTEDGKIKDNLIKLIPAIFNYRVKAIKWLIEEKGINFKEIINDVYPQLDDLRSNPQLAMLAENILFAVRCNQRVLNAMFSIDGFAEGLEQEISSVPVVTYEQFLAGVAYIPQDDYSVQKVVDWVHSSLYIEFILLAATIINDESLSVSQKGINEMAFIVADAAQEYMAIASELGLLQTGSDKYKHKQEPLLSKKEIKEQGQLADFGLLDFAKNF